MEYAFANDWSFGLEGRIRWYGTHTFKLRFGGSITAPGGGFLFAAATQSMQVQRPR